MKLPSEISFRSSPSVAEKEEGTSLDEVGDGVGPGDEEPEEEERRVGGDGVAGKREWDR